MSTTSYGVRNHGHMCWDTLYGPDEDFVMRPQLCEGHAVEDDGLRWVFTLREGVRSPYGNELTAADVEWSWQKSFAQRRTGLFIANVSNVTGAVLDAPRAAAMATPT